jgi:hypothetical protein
MRSEKARLRTRVERGGMNYKGFNIAVHELGHNVEQVFSLNAIDHTLLQGVPNTAFTEAFAFVFQARDLELLGLSRPKGDEALAALHDFWMTVEIAGVALVDMELWHWMYEHPSHAGGAEDRRLRNLGHLEPLLRAIFAMRYSGSTPTSSTRSLPSDIPWRDCLPDRRADAEGGETRGGIRTDGGRRPDRPRSLDAESHRLSGRRGCAPGCGSSGVEKVTRTIACS